MSTLDRYPDLPAYREMTRTKNLGDRGIVTPLLPVPQPGVTLNEGRLSLDEFQSAIYRAVEEGAEEYTFLYARPVGATLVYGQFDLAHSIRARAYCVTNSLVPSMDGSEWIQGGYRQSHSPLSSFPSKAEYSKRIKPGKRKDGSDDIYHDLQLPNADPVDMGFLTRVAIERGGSAYAQFMRALNLEPPAESGLKEISLEAIRGVLNRGFRSVLTSTVSMLNRDWTNNQAPIDWNEAKVERVWEGMQMAINGAETIANRINTGFNLTDAEPGVTVAIPLLASEGGTHPSHQKIVGNHDELSFRNLLLWHARLWLPRYGVSVDEAFAKIREGKTLQMPNF